MLGAGSDCVSGNVLQYVEWPGLLRLSPLWPVGAKLARWVVVCWARETEKSGEHDNSINEGIPIKRKCGSHCQTVKQSIRTKSHYRAETLKAEVVATMGSNIGMSREIPWDIVFLVHTCLWRQQHLSINNDVTVHFAVTTLPRLKQNLYFYRAKMSTSILMLHTSSFCGQEFDIGSSGRFQSVTSVWNSTTHCSSMCCQC